MGVLPLLGTLDRCWSGFNLVFIKKFLFALVFSELSGGWRIQWSSFAGQHGGVQVRRVDRDGSPATGTRGGARGDSG